MLHFESDYITGAHPKVLEKLCEINNLPQVGYGEDDICKKAGEKIKKALHKEDAEIYFIAGGTQTNQVVISSLLKPFEGVVAVETGHIACHEAGAIECTGHKVITLPQHRGKADAEELKNLLETFYADKNHEHMVFPGMLYISHPTEYGTLYSKKELTALSQVCRAYQIPLYLDGARLAYALTSHETDVTLEDLANLCDVFYIGGTKEGAFVGEAVVFCHHNMPRHFPHWVKKHGAMLAKGWLIGAQFDALFTDDLYFEIGRHANLLARKLEKLLPEKQIPLFIQSPTNQVFGIVENKRWEVLSDKVKFGFWEKYDDTHTVVRLATCHSTTEKDIEDLEAIL